MTSGANGELTGKQVAITGRLASMSRQDAVALIESRGGRYVGSPDAATQMLVVGGAGWPLRSDGRVTHDLETAYRLREEGCDITIASETEFLELAGEGDAAAGLDRLYTTQQLSRILDVPASQINAWVRKGLIEPVKVISKLCYFDFADVANAKTLKDLIGSGVSPERLRKSLEDLQKWRPDAARSFAQLGLMAAGDRVLVRLEDGALAEPSGQLHFDLDGRSQRPEAESYSLARVAPATASEIFDHAVELEYEGRLGEAAQAYHQAMLVEGPRAELAFNLGNVLYDLGRFDAAAQRYMQAVEIDSDYVEGWNNLGNALMELDRHGEAITVFRRALAIQPGYADAQFNVGEALFQEGRLVEARHHWKAYLELDPASAWASRVRARLAEMDELDA